MPTVFPGEAGETARRTAATHARAEMEMTATTPRANNIFVEFFMVELMSNAWFARLSPAPHKGRSRRVKSYLNWLIRTVMPLVGSDEEDEKNRKEA